MDPVFTNSIALLVTIILIKIYFCERRQKRHRLKRKIFFQNIVIRTKKVFSRKLPLLHYFLGLDLNVECRPRPVVQQLADISKNPDYHRNIEIFQCSGTHVEAPDRRYTLFLPTWPWKLLRFCPFFGLKRFLEFSYFGKNKKC